jgi:hypothetical protein
MDRATELDIVRRAYAKQMLAVTVRREGAFFRTERRTPDFLARWMRSN